jgi:hypothetical protein
MGRVPDAVLRVAAYAATLNAGGSAVEYNTR